MKDWSMVRRNVSTAHLLFSIKDSHDDNFGKRNPKLIPKRALTFVDARKKFDDSPLNQSSKKTSQEDEDFDNVAREIETMNYILEKMKKDFEDIRKKTERIQHNLVEIRHEKCSWTCELFDQNIVYSNFKVGLFSGQNNA